MISFKIQPSSFHIYQSTPNNAISSSPRINFLSVSVVSKKVNSSLRHEFNALSSTVVSSFPSNCVCKHEFGILYRVSDSKASVRGVEEEKDEPKEFEDLATDGVVYMKTLRLVECAMFAAVAGLAYFLSNSLAIENYFGCFFSLPIVISSMRWGPEAGRKTMVATAMLLLTLSGPVKATTYLLLHGLVGLAMGYMWRSGANWGLSVFLCTFVRAMGAMGYLFLSSFLIRENILALITVNVHATLTYTLTAIGVNTIPSMDVIYSIFGTLLLLNCGFSVFLLHILYAVFLIRLGMKTSLTLPRWLEKAM